MTSVKIVITGVVSIVIQFGLAIAGWGGWTAFWSHPAFEALAGVTAVLMVLAAPSGGGLSTGEHEDRSNRWVQAAFSVIALLMSFFSAYTDRIGFWTLDGDTMRWVGVAICFAGGVVRIRSEERLLREHFGAEYDAYVARTWRLVPGIY
jgi:hypothetical protein